MTRSVVMVFRYRISGMYTCGWSKRVRRKCELGNETCLQWVRGGRLRGVGGDIRVCTIRFVAHDREKKKGGKGCCVVMARWSEKAGGSLLSEPDFFSRSTLGEGNDSLPAR